MMRKREKRTKCATTMRRTLPKMSWVSLIITWYVPSFLAALDLQNGDQWNQRLTTKVELHYESPDAELQKFGRWDGNARFDTIDFAKMTERYSTFPLDCVLFHH